MIAMNPTAKTEAAAAPTGSAISFSKLEALGNDFVLIDARRLALEVDPGTVRRWADRRLGIGFDQLLVLRDAGGDAYCAVDIHNADGSRAEQCGNGMRAVALWLHRFDHASGALQLETAAGPVEAHFRGDDDISATLGVPEFQPAAVGLEWVESFPWQTDVDGESLTILGASLGNPHLLVVEDQTPTPDRLERIGPPLGTHPALSHGANVGLAAVESRHRVQLRVHERGAGPTRACGSGATAAAAILIEQGRVDCPVEVVQPGGMLVVNWEGQGQTLRTSGPAHHVFEGVIQWPTHPN